jgi:hydrogenase maturation protease
VRILVLGLGNDILSDDAAGILAARGVCKALCTVDVGDAEVAVVESSVAGVALLEIFVDHDLAIVIDAIVTGKKPPGFIHELSPSDLGAVQAPSPHYAGLPEIIALASSYEMVFPREVKILALEVLDPLTIGGALSKPVEAALPRLVDRVVETIRAWTSGS